MVFPFDNLRKEVSIQIPLKIIVNLVINASNGATFDISDSFKVF